MREREEVAKRSELCAVSPLARYRREVEAEVKENILRFWLDHSRDPAGGFWGQVRSDLTVEVDAPRSSILCSRILWTFSAAWRQFKVSEYRLMAEAAYATLQRCFLDERRGGIIWSVGPDGTPIDDRKYAYAQAFGIYGLSEYHLATGDPHSLALAIELYRLLERHARDAEHGGYFEVHDDEWGRLPHQKGFAAMPVAKLQNTMMHVMEAYANLLRAWPDESLEQALSSLIALTGTHVYDCKARHLVQHFNADWSPAPGEFSLGHDIECSWLLLDAVSLIDDPELHRSTRLLAEDLATSTIREGFDSDGGLFDVRPTPSGAQDKHWWVQAEAAVGFLSAYQLTREPEFFDASVEVWTFIREQIVDRERGEWFPCKRTSAMIDDAAVKIGFWKCPYHNARACMELVKRLDQLMAE